MALGSRRRWRRRSGAWPRSAGRAPFPRSPWRRSHGSFISACHSPRARRNDTSLRRRSCRVRSRLGPSGSARAHPVLRPHPVPPRGRSPLSRRRFRPVVARAELERPSLDRRSRVVPWLRPAPGAARPGRAARAQPVRALRGRVRALVRRHDAACRALRLVDRGPSLGSRTEQGLRRREALVRSSGPSLRSSDP